MAIQPRQAAPGMKAAATGGRDMFRVPVGSDFPDRQAKAL